MSMRIVPVLVVACAMSSSVQAFQGQMFDPPVISPAGANPVALDSGDLNGDGFVDVVRGDRDNQGVQAVFVYFGDGAGGLSPAIGYDGVPDTRELRLEDVDLDGDLDIVTIGGSGMFLLFNDGLGTFATTTLIQIPSGAQHMDMADLDHDGDQDVCVSFFGSQQVVVMINDGSANFTASSSHALPLPGADVELADLDGDGELDLIVTGNNHDQGDTVYVFLGDGTGGFGSRTGYFAGANCTAGLAAADFDGDGHVDVVAGTCAGLSVLSGNGTGALGFPMPLTSPTWPANWAPIPAVGDFDGDGRADLVGLVTGPAPLNGVITVFSYDPPLGWEIDGDYDIGGSGGWGAVHVVDLDSDGFPDLAVCSANQFAPQVHTALDCNQNGLFDPEEAEDDPSIEEVNCQAIDTDEDGLSDEDELLLGTDPFDPDTDDDGLLDGTEVDIAAGTGCPDPLDPDSDDDGLADGEESLLGTDSCNADSDNDGIPDGIDPLPLDSGGTQDALEIETRDLCDFILGIELQLFSAPNNNARHGRRTALCNKSTSAANMIAAGNNIGAIMKLQGLLELLSGAAQNGPWMLPSLERDYVVSTATDIIVVLEFL